MPEYIGNIPIPEIAVFTALPLPVCPDYPYTVVMEPQIVTHRFGAANYKREQRFYLGSGVRQFLVRSELSLVERGELMAFWEARKGAYQPFLFNAPKPDGTTEQLTVRFANEPISYDFLEAALASTGVNLVELAIGTPEKTVSSTVTRFPSEALKSGLLPRIQEIIPLVKITPKLVGWAGAGYSDVIYLSDRRVKIDLQLYQPRLIDWDGISQTMTGGADEAQFNFGNADRVMTAVVNAVDLFRADIEFSLYHVGTGIKLDLWKGEITDWTFDGGTAFQATASDGIYELGLPYPPRRICRTCWKPFDDAANCPYATQGALDLVHFPSANAAECDHGYATDNGCLAHGMKRYFGAIIIEPQSVNLKDYSRGTLSKWGGTKITSSSLVGDTIYNQPLQEVYTDEAMPVNCQLAAYRDESEFKSGLGIVSEGPITSYKAPGMVNGRLISHILDGLPHHGYGTNNPSYGLREALGIDPANAGDYFSLGETGDRRASKAEPWRYAYGGASTYLENYAAGVAFVELRVSDAMGVQLSRVTDHQMKAWVDAGMGGWTWSDPATRIWQAPLINPVWIAVNVLLKARARRGSEANPPSMADQLALFDVGAAISAAAICSDVVTKLIGDGTETQFTFRGYIAEERPLRDWISDVLANCLGYYTFAFGRLKIGLRKDSVAVESFTVGNILADSLRLGPIKPSFNHLSANFADREFEWKNNVVELSDIDHALRLGGAASPLYLKTQLNLSGTSTKSQTSRIVITRLREETGGITEPEQTRARAVSFKTTVLALNTEPGMVCSIEHEDMPGGWITGANHVQTPKANYGEFRVLSWKLNKDYSIEISGGCTYDSMYNYVIGDKPADVLASPIDPELFNWTNAPAWLPFTVAAIAGTAPHTFGIAPVYEDSANGTKIARLKLRGLVRVTVVNALNAPMLDAAAAVATTGGTIPGSRTVYIAVCPRAANNSLGARSRMICKAEIPAGTNTNTATFGVGSWDAGTTAYSVFAGDDPNQLSWQQDGTGTPTSIVLDHLYKDRWACPDPASPSLLVQITRGRHFGIGAQTVIIDGVNSRIQFPGVDFTGCDLTDYIASVLAVPGLNEIPVADFAITAMGTDYVTVTPNPGTVGILDESLVVIRTKATIGADAGGNYIQDLRWVNPLSGGTGLALHAEMGSMLLAISPEGESYWYTIADNDQTKIWIMGTWTVIPTSTWRFLVIESTWQWSKLDGPYSNDNQSFETNILCDIDNLKNQPLLVRVLAVNFDGLQSPERLAPCRDFYLFGAAGALADGYYVIPYAATVTPDLANGKNQRITLSGDVTINAPAGTPVAGDWLQIKIVQDTPGGRQVAWDALYTGLMGKDPDVRPAAYSLYQFTFDGTNWELSSYVSGT